MRSKTLDIRERLFMLGNDCHIDLDNSRRRYMFYHNVSTGGFYRFKYEQTPGARSFLILLTITFIIPWLIS